MIPDFCLAPGLAHPVARPARRRAAPAASSPSRWPWRRSPPWASSPTASRAAWRAMRASCWAAMRWWSATAPRRTAFIERAQGAGPDRASPPLIFPSMAPRARRRGRRQPAGRAQGRAGRLSAARQPAAVADSADAPGSHHARRAAAAARPGSTAPLLEALGLKLGDPLLLGDAQLAHRPRHHCWSRTAAPASSTSRRA